MIHLDTSFLIRALVKGSAEDSRLRAWIRNGEQLGASALVWTEFLCGPLAEEENGLVAVILGEPAPFTPEAAAVAAGLFNGSGRRRGSLIDCMIAAAAITGNARLATSNVADFQKLTRLGLELAT